MQRRWYLLNRMVIVVEYNGNACPKRDHKNRGGPCGRRSSPWKRKDGVKSQYEGCARLDTPARLLDRVMLSPHSASPPSSLLPFSLSSPRLPPLLPRRVSQNPRRRRRPSYVRLLRRSDSRRSFVLPLRSSCLAIVAVRRHCPFSSCRCALRLGLVLRRERRARLARSVQSKGAWAIVRNV